MKKIVVNLNQVVSNPNDFSMPLFIIYNGVEYNNGEKIKRNGDILGWEYHNIETATTLFIQY